jgi:hypothetical protein
VWSASFIEWHRKSSGAWKQHPRTKQILPLRMISWHSGSKIRAASIAASSAADGCLGQGRTEINHLQCLPFFLGLRQCSSGF